MPPIHPAIVHFPIALLIFSIFADLIGYIKNHPAWRAAGRWSLAAAFITGGLAAIAGVMDMNRADLGESVHDYVHLHMYTGLILLVAVTCLTVWRWMVHK